MTILSTITTIINFILLIGTCIGLLPKLYKMIRSIEGIKDDIYNKFDEVNKRLDDVDESTCKNYLVGFLKNLEQGEPIDEVEKERAYEIYEQYIKEGHNGYIKARWAKCEKRGLL